MTTIAYHHKDGQIAVDSLATQGGRVLTEKFNKVITNELGMWIICGVTCDYARFIMMKPLDVIDVELEVSAILIRDKKAFSVYQNKDGHYCEDELTCNDTHGSGADFATAAMDHGKSAKEAIEYAITRDIYTGGKVQVIDVKTGKVIS